jgi:hypothetical protein
MPSPRTMSDWDGMTPTRLALGTPKKIEPFADSYAVVADGAANPPAETPRGPRGLREGVVQDLGRLYRLRRNPP